jgi:hypothetical protein
MDFKNSFRRPNIKEINPEITTFRHNEKHSTIIRIAMEEYDLGKSELLRHIIIEWNMLRYNN